MEYISSFNAKAQLSKLLANVAIGHEYVITNRNRVIAKLIPFGGEHDNIEHTIAEIKKFRKKFKLSAKEISRLRLEGRK